MWLTNVCLLPVFLLFSFLLSLSLLNFLCYPDFPQNWKPTHVTLAIGIFALFFSIYFLNLYCSVNLPQEQNLVVY